MISPPDAFDAAVDILFAQRLRSSHHESSFLT
jgi:hypothetical protein